jgi:predicted nucleotide-binding protein
MTYYHVRLQVDGQRHDEVKLDLDETTLDAQFLAPYRQGGSITVNGKTIAIQSVARIRISASEVSSTELLEAVRKDQAMSRVVSVGGPSYAWRAAAKATDVTDQFVTGPPGQESGRGEAGDAAQSSGQGDRRSVFLVCGRDGKAIEAVTAFLRSLDLQIVEWNHAVAKTGLPAPYVGDVVQQGLEMADAAVVLVTPDDLVKLRPDLQTDGDSQDEREVRGQGRPNVYYEAGLADAIGRQRTVIVEVGNPKSFSDAVGRHTIRYDGSPAKRHTFVERLRLAGLSPETTGEGWLSAGDIGTALDQASDAISTAEESATQSATVDKEALIKRIDQLLTQLEVLRGASQYDDLSDRPDETLEFVIQAHALIERFAPGSPYAAEAARASGGPAHLRFPVLAATLKAYRADLMQ